MALNILIVDDSSVVRAMIRKILKMAGVEVGQAFEAANGQEGLAVLEGNWVDLVLADLNMPVMNGQEMIERVRANPLWQDLPIVVVSTEGSETRIAALREKNVRFIHKPFAPETVRKVVADLLENLHEQPSAR